MEDQDHQIEPEDTTTKTQEPSQPTPLRPVNYQMISAIAISIISLCALVVSIYQTRLLISQNEMNTRTAKAQMWPRLELSSGGNFDKYGAKEVFMSLQNVGTGPAIIDNFTINFRGDTLNSWWPIYNQLFLSGTNPKPIISMVNNPPRVDQVLQAGETVELLRISPNVPEEVRDSLGIFFSDDQLILQLCYRSVFTDQWQISGPFGGKMEHKVAEDCLIGNQD